MRVRINDSYGKSREVELSNVLTPSSHDFGSGAIEGVKNQAEANAEAIGRLLEYLVERNKMTLEKAQEIAGYYGNIEKV